MKLEKIKIKYYGEIAESIGEDQEFLFLKEKDIFSLISYLQNTYDVNTSLIKIAVNQKLVAENKQLTTEDEIAILSPFAGG